MQVKLCSPDCDSLPGSLPCTTKPDWLPGRTFITHAGGQVFPCLYKAVLHALL